jgi:MtN3 and saliva related transmembrane protein
MIITTLATITGVLMPLGYYHQAWKIWKTRSAKDISIPLFVISAIGTASWFAYGWYLHDPIVILSFALGGVGSWTTLFLSLKYKEKKNLK